MEEMYLSAMIRDALHSNEEFSLTVDSEGAVISTSKFSVSIGRDLTIAAYCDDAINYEDIKSMSQIANIFKCQSSTLGKLIMDCGKEEV